MSSKKWRNLHALKERLTKSISRRTKKILYSVGASLLIGLLFGMISLQMASNEGSKAESGSASTNVANGVNEVTKQETFDSVSFHVVQAGMFQEAANAKKWSNHFTEAGFPTVEWERDEQIYLIAAIGDSKEACAEIATKMKNAELDVFVKEWEVKSETLAVTEEDEQYLQMFLDKWHQSLEKENIESLLSLVDVDTNLSATTQALKVEIKELSQEDEMNNQLFLLESIKAYEKLFK